MNIIYDQTFLERVTSFFVIETNINQDIVNIAWDKWSQIKEKTSETIKNAFKRKNILEILIEPRKLVIPLNKYDTKRSKILVVDFGKIIMKNTDPIYLYDERYKLDIINTNIKVKFFFYFLILKKSIFYLSIKSMIQMPALN